MRRWGLYCDRGHWVIRRGLERMPASRYGQFRHDEVRLRAFVKSLNAPSRAVEAVEWKHAQISPQVLDDYYDWLLLQVPNQANAKYEHQNVKIYFLNYFVGQLNLLHPYEWHQACDTRWAKHLLTLNLAPRTLWVIIQAANRFVRWMHKRRPEFMPNLNFEPFSKAARRKMDADYELNNSRHRRTYIRDVDWEVVVSKLPVVKRKNNKPFTIASLVLLAYHYGLRRSEALGLRLEDVRRDHLQIERQLVTLKPTYSPTKGRAKRKCNHWFATNVQAYTWISTMTPVTPKDFSNQWREFMDLLGMRYDLHDLRHTFITKAARAYAYKDVMDAVGHNDPKTTKKYTHDDRELSDEVFKPTG